MVLAVDNVSRRFGPTVACDRVSFNVERGEIVALLGENGAGKSTLLSCIAGFITPDSGSVRVDGEALALGDPASSIRLGIGTAFQHFSLAPGLTVRESFHLARLNASRVKERLPESLSQDARIGDLTVSERQQVELLKARMLAHKVLLLDEPTSLLGDADVDRVLHDIQKAADDGIAVVFVTHRLHEALAVADRVIVMRRGYVVDANARWNGEWPDGIEQSLLAEMFGDAYAGLPDADDNEYGRSRNRAYSGEIVARGMLNGAPETLSLPRGHSLAIAGIAGNGQQGVVDMLSGIEAQSFTLTSGEGDARNLAGSELRSWIAKHVTVVPEDRLREGGSVAMPVGENLVLRDLVDGRLAKSGIVRMRRTRERAGELIDRWNIRPADPHVPLGTLSGGNVQRVLLARALDPLPEMLVAVRPTHGLDHHSVAMVREQLERAVEQGTTVVTIEQEFDEAIRHADLVAVIYQGRLSEPVPTRDADRAELQRMMVSGWVR